MIQTEEHWGKLMKLVYDNEWYNFQLKTFNSCEFPNYQHMYIKHLKLSHVHIFIHTHAQIGKRKRGPY